MSKVRYIDAFECQECYQTHDSENRAKSCCGGESERLKGFECKSCFEIRDNIEEVRNCCPDPKPDYIKEIDLTIPLSEYDSSDEIMIGGISIIKTEGIAQ